MLYHFFLLRLYCRKTGKSNFFVDGNLRFKFWVIIIPEGIGMIGNFFEFFSLALTFASSVAMIGCLGNLIVAVLSVFLFKRKYKIIQWMGIVAGVIGCIILNLADYINQSSSEDYDTKSVMIGNLMVFLYVCCSGITMTVSEKWMIDFDLPPMYYMWLTTSVVLIVQCLLWIPLYYIKVPPPFNQNERGSLEDPIDAFYQFKNNTSMLVMFIVYIFVIGPFNLVGMTIQKKYSSTSRMVYGTMIKIGICAMSVICFKEKPHWSKYISIVIILIGVFMYKEMTPKKIYDQCKGKKKNDDTAEADTNANVDSNTDKKGDKSKA